MKKLKILIPAFIIFIILVSNSCIKDDLNTPPGTVTLTSPLKAANDVALTDSLTWLEAIDLDDDLIKYDVYFSTNEDPDTIVSLRQEGTSYGPSLVAGTTYYWKIVAQDGAEGSSESEIWSFTTKGNTNNPPGVFSLSSPSNGAKDIAHDDVLLNWNASIDPDGDAVSYDVLLGTSSNPTTQLSSAQSGTSFVPTLLTGTTYYWKVVASDGNGGTSESAVWSFSTTGTNNPPGAFTLLSPANGALDNLYYDFLLKWNVSTDPDGDEVTYDVLLSTDANPSTAISSHQTSTSYGPTLASGTKYYWKVIASDGNGGSSVSAIWSFTTLNNPPGEVTLLSPDDAEPDVSLDADLTWQATTDPDGDAVTYDVYFGISEVPATIVSSGQTGTAYSPSLSEKTTYFWKIVVRDGKGRSRESDVWSFTTLGTNNPPGAFNLLSPDDSEVPDVALDASLTWQAATDPDGDVVTYDIYFGTSEVPSTVVRSGQTETSYSPSLSESTTYFWKIIASDGKGGTSESAVWSFTTVSTNNPPGDFLLITPSNGDANVTYDDFLLTWNGSRDPDGDAVTYDVYLDTNSNPSTVVSSGQSDISFIPSIPAASATYYWKVVASDGRGGTTESAIWSFTTRNNQPGEFSLRSPANSAEGILLTASLTWQASTDPDGDTVTYDVYFGTSATPTTLVSSEQVDRAFSPTLNSNVIYYWKVVAKDGNGGERESETWSFKTVIF